MDTRHRSLLLTIIVLLVLFGTQFVDFGAGHEATVQGLALLFGLGAVVGTMLGLESLRSRSGDE